MRPAGCQSPALRADPAVPCLLLRHRTQYRYTAPVHIGPHRLMLRPRESRLARLNFFDLSIKPTAQLSWAHDVFDNAVATAVFPTMSDTLTIESIAEVNLDADPWPVFDIAVSALSYPFLYSRDQWTDLGALAVPVYADPAGRLRAWTQGFIRDNPTDTLSLLKDLSAGISAQIGYQARDDAGTQTPLQTLDRGWGSCRDFAVLLAEAARTLTFGARIVSGYLHNPDGDLTGQDGDGSTHAWTEIHVPGAGWISFDPTNRAVGGYNLIPVAVARDIEQAMPVIGSYAGPPGAFGTMTVQITISDMTDAQEHLRERTRHGRR